MSQCKWALRSSASTARKRARADCRHELADRSAAPFGPAGFLSLSEVGYAVPDIEATVKDVQREREPYRAPSPTFAPLGDAHGLLIVAAFG